MLLGFRIKNYRSIKDEVYLDLQASSDNDLQSSSVFEVGKVALLRSVGIYGGNAFGKTNILRGFLVFRQMVLESLLRSNMPEPLPWEPFKLSTETENQPSLFEIRFIVDDEIYVYGFASDRNRITSEWLKRESYKVPLFERSGQNIEVNKNYFKEASTELRNQTSERVLLLSLLSSYNKPLSKKIVQFIQKTELISDNRSSLLEYSFGKFVNDDSMKEKMKDLIKKIILVEEIEGSQKLMSPDEATKFIPDEFKALLLKQNSQVAERQLAFLYNKYSETGEKLERQPIDFMNGESLGVQQLFYLSAPIINTLEEGKVLFIDEIESSLHPIACKYLTSLFNSRERNPNNAQLIFTTHNLSLLDEENFRRDQIYFVDKDKYGATDLFSLWDISERKNISFAKRYMEGRYGALPYISDYENLKFANRNE